MLPYGLAIVAQLPMLILYFKELWARPHYQFFPFAIIATVSLAVMRWPTNSEIPFQRSRTSDFLMILGLFFALLGGIFVEPPMSAVSLVLIVTSLFARTYDAETGKTLWTCAVPLFVCLILPNNYDNIIITRLQAYSAGFTSQLMDLIGLGHHLSGTVIIVPGMKQYGVEEACSGVVSFFTLLAITSVFIVWYRRISVPKPFLATLLVITGLSIMVVEAAVSQMGYFSLAGVSLILMGCFGFRAAVLLLSAVFWALFMNTVRILSIPVADYMLGLDLSTGLKHDLLGYTILLVGVLLILSTDQFLLFLFGPVEDHDDEMPSTRRITRFWNGFIAGNSQSEDSSSRRRQQRSTRKALTSADMRTIWTITGVMLAIGLWQLVDVQRSLASPEYTIRLFDSNTKLEFSQNDVPEVIGDNWKLVQYSTQDRKRGSDQGERSDVWQFRAPGYQPVASLDQTFPGWHELTTCYQFQGWKMKKDPLGNPSRFRRTPPAEGDEEPWQYIEAEFEKDTGEKGYLLFSHFDAFGNPIEAPENWGSLNSFFVRAKNRLSHRIRASLFEGEAYQTQVFLQSFNEIDEDKKNEVKERYLEIREHMRQRFKEKRASET